MSPARDELRKMASKYWSQPADNWWIGEYLRGIIMNDFEDKERVLDLTCELTEEEWIPIKGHLVQWIPSFREKYVNDKAIEGVEERSKVAYDIDLLRAFS